MAEGNRHGVSRVVCRRKGIVPSVPGGMRIFTGWSNGDMRVGDGAWWLWGWRDKKKLCCRSWGLVVSRVVWRDGSGPRYQADPVLKLWWRELGLGSVTWCGVVWRNFMGPCHQCLAWPEGLDDLPAVPDGTAQDHAEDHADNLRVARGHSVNT